ncbi:MAG: sialidase family protein, partial [Anaerolineae bacterium]
TDLPCHVYLPVVAANWRQPWPSATPTPAVEQLPINVVYVNHVEVESVLDYFPPPVAGTTYDTTSAKYAYTSGQLEWEMAQAEAVGARVSFHMSGAYAERAVEAGAQAPWSGHLADGHTVGVHFHSFLRGPQPFQWTYSPSPSQQQIAQAWQDNHDLVADLVGAEALWVGESHYACPSCWDDLDYQLRTTEQMAQLPAGQHIVWLVERDRAGVITYPHFPQIGQAAWHGPAQNRNYFDLRVPQLKKEFLMLYLEWLERERLGLESQVWAFGWLNHGGRNTDLYADEIQEMFTWMSDNFAGRTSPRGNVIAEFVSDHQLYERYQAYEQAGGQPLPPPVDNVNDQFPYMAHALEDAGVTADLSAELGLPGVRLFELERAPAENPPPGAPPKVYLLFRESDGSAVVDISGLLASRGVDATNLTLINVVDGSTGPADGRSLLLGPTPLVLEAAAPPPASELNFVPDPGFRIEDASNPAASVDPETGTVYLFYEDRSTMPGRRMVATSSDGLSFSAGRPPTEVDNPHHPFHVRLPDGAWRKYLFDQVEGLKSESSPDGIHYTPDPGVRYTLQPGDNGTAGVHDQYVDPAGGVVLLYIGDMGGVNNVRRAYSPPGDNGWTFAFEDDNVLGDVDAGGGGNSYVDPKSILLPDGRRRLFTMRGGPAPPQPGVRAAGAIYSFISDDGKTYALEPGVRLTPDAFTEFDVWSLNDPVVVRLPDGRYRMYVAALVTDGPGDNQWVIVSATTVG